MKKLRYAVQKSTSITFFTLGSVYDPEGTKIRSITKYYKISRNDLPPRNILWRTLCERLLRITGDLNELFFHPHLGGDIACVAQMRPIAADWHVPWSTLCCACRWAVRKRMNRSRCRSGGGYSCGPRLRSRCIGTIWQNDWAAMRPYVKLLWPLV